MLKKFKLRFSLSAVSFAVLSPVLIAASCTPEAVAISQPANKQVYFVNPLIQDSPTRKQLRVDNILRSDLRNIATRGLGFFNAEMLAGGFGEARKFYSDSGVEYIHNGTDVLLPANEAILAPANGEVIASFWYQNTKAGSDFANGIGGIIIMRVKVADLDLSAEDKAMLYVKYGTGDKVAPVPRFVFKQLDHTYVYPEVAKTIIATVENKLVVGETTPEGELVITNRENTERRSNFHHLVDEKAYQDYLALSDSKLKDDAARAEAAAKRSRDDGTVLLQFMHASKDSPNALITSQNEAQPFTEDGYEIVVNTNIDTNHPLNVKKGTVIGYVGNLQDNGGWVPHLHLTVHLAHINGLFDRFEGYTDLIAKNNAELRAQVTRFHGRGIQAVSGSFSAFRLQNSREYLNSLGFANANAIYQLYDQNTPVVRYDASGK